MGSLDHTLALARTLDGDALALVVIDWSELFDARARPQPRLCFASAAATRMFEGAALDAIESALRRALSTQRLKSADALADDEPFTLTLVPPLGRLIHLHRPRAEAPHALALLTGPETASVESALRRSEARYRAIVEDQTDFIVRYRPDGVRTFVNDAYVAFFGGTPEDFIGHSFLSLIADEHLPAVVDKIRRLVEREADVLVDEHLSLRHDGVQCWTHWIDRAIFDDDGTLIELQAVGRDITDIKQAEQRLARAQKLEALGTLAGGLAHDFNNTLSGILGLAELIATSLDDRRTIVELAHDIVAATERASELTRSLLQLSRRAPTRLVDCDMRELVESAARLLRASIPRRIELELELDELPSMPADAGQLTQALINLGINARDAISEAGMIKIAARIERRELVLSVTDDGAGIPEHVRAHLFEPFFTTKPDGQGTGLGLAMVYACARAHGGRVEVDSELGLGTRFEIYLPIELERDGDASACS